AYGVDAWSLLAAIAARTSRVRLGTLLTPLPWRRPWKVASQVATLDQLSGGRAILSVGLGALATDLPDTGEVTGTRPRTDLMAEGETPAGDDSAAAAALTPWAEAGCTWWLESRWEMPHHGPERMAQVRQRLAAGPPRPAAAPR